MTKKLKNVRIYGTVLDMFPRSILRVGFLASGFVWTTANLSGQQPPAVAHVLDVKGDWRLQGSNSAIAVGQSLAGGSKILAGSNRPGDTITIIRDEDMSRLWTACDSTVTNPCLKPIVIDAASTSPPEQSQMKSMVQTALAILLNRPPAIVSHYALTLSRGSQPVREWEGIVSLDPAQGIVLPPAPADMPAGQYFVSIAPGGDTSAASIQTTELTSGGTWRPFPLRKTGLYEFSIMNSSGETVADAIFLVVPAAEHETRRQRFDAMKNRTATWTGPNARSDEHLFLRAFLLSECQSC